MFSGFVPNDSHHRRQTEPRHVAGGMAVRAQRPSRLPKAVDHPQRLSTRFHVYPSITRESNGEYEQLGTSLGAFIVETLNGLESKPEV